MNTSKSDSHIALQGRHLKAHVLANMPTAQGHLSGSTHLKAWTEMAFRSWEPARKQTEQKRKDQEFTLGLSSVRPYLKITK